MNIFTPQQLYPKGWVPGTHWTMGQGSPHSQSLVVKDKILTCARNKVRSSRRLSYRSVTVKIVKDTNKQLWDLNIIKLWCCRLWHSRLTSLSSHGLCISLYKVLVNASRRSWQFPSVAIDSSNSTLTAPFSCITAVLETIYCDDFTPWTWNKLQKFISMEYT